MNECHRKYYIIYCFVTTQVNLQYVPVSLIQAVAGNKPFRPLRPPMQGASNIELE